MVFVIQQNKVRHSFEPSALKNTKKHTEPFKFSVWNYASLFKSFALS